MTQAEHKKLIFAAISRNEDDLHTHSFTQVCETQKLERKCILYEIDRRQCGSEPKQCEN